MEQPSICVRYIDSSGAIKEMFLEFHVAPKSDSETLTTIVKFGLLSLTYLLHIPAADKLTMVQLI